MRIRHQIPDRKVASTTARAEHLEPRMKKAANDLELFCSSIAWILTATSHFDPFLLTALTGTGFCHILSMVVVDGGGVASPDLPSITWNESLPGSAQTGPRSD